MFTSHVLAFAVVASATFTQWTNAQPTFQPIGPASLTSGVTNGGTLAIGSDYGLPFRWRPDSGRESLPLPSGVSGLDVVDASDDGTAILGTSEGSLGSAVRTFLWNDAHGWSEIGNGNIRGRSISGNGQVIGGNAGSAPFRWSTGAGVQILDFPISDVLESYITAMSFDGSVLIGSARSLPQTAGFRLASTTGYELLPAGTAFGYAYGPNHLACSADGSVASGYGTTALGSTWTYAWSQGASVTTPWMINPYLRNYILDLSADGHTSVGYWKDGVPGAQGNERAMIFRDGEGVSDLNTLLPTLGVNLSGWTLERATRVSPDGFTIMGFGRHEVSPGQFEYQAGWIATIPTPQSLLPFLLGIRCLRRGRTAEPGAKA